jgi:HEAT repeat protein
LRQRTAAFGLKLAFFVSCLLTTVLMVTPSAMAQVKKPARKPIPKVKTLSELIKLFEAQAGKPYMDRYRYVSRFSRFKTEASARYLENIYKSDPDANIKRMAVSALANMSIPYARKVLLEVLQDPTATRYILTYAVRGIARSNDMDSFKLLLSLIKAPPRGQSSWPLTSNEGQRNTAVLKGLRDCKYKGKADILIAEVLSKPKGKALWHKKKLITIAATKTGKEDHADVFLRLTHERDVNLRSDAVYALDISPLSDPAAKRLIKLLSDKSPVVVISATVVIGKHGPEAALKPLIKISKGKNFGAAAAAVEALGAYPEDKGALSALKKSLNKKKPWQLVAAAIAGFAKRHKRDSIEILMKALGKLDGRLLADACKALKGLTGQDLGHVAKDWKNWWRAVKKSFTMPDQEALAKRRKKAAKGPKMRLGTKSRNPSYYGSEVVSKRLTFIVDFSGSMNSKVKTAEGEASRLELAKAELIKVVKGLSKTAYFNLVFFGTNFESWKKTIVKANNKFKGQAIKHTQDAGGMGGTNIFDPLEKALQDPNVDTIYLLSDGGPSAGKFIAPADILREIKKLNATRRIVIHTISFGMKSKFMKDLAKQNGGDYIER